MGGVDYNNLLNGGKIYIVFPFFYIENVTVTVTYIVKRNSVFKRITVLKQATPHKTKKPDIQGIIKK